LTAGECTYTIVGTAARFEWDDAKNRSNLRKHGIDFETACCVFDDPLAVSRAERIVEHEVRWQTVGSIGGVLVVLVAHSYQEGGGHETIRIISARKATAGERKFYERGA
jgi:uncharacterized protein